MVCLTKKLLKNRSIFMSTPGPWDEKANTAAIKHSWPLLQGEERRSQTGKTPERVGEAQRKETTFTSASCKMGLVITTQ